MWWQRDWLIILFAVIATLFIAPDVFRVYEQYPTVGFEADNDGVIFDVQEWVKRDLKDCRQIDIANTTFENRVALFAGLGGKQYVRPSLPSVQFMCKEPHGERTIYPRATAWSALMSPDRVLLLIQQIIGLLFIVLATTLVWQIRSIATFGFFFFAIWFNPGLNYFTYAEAQRLPYLVPLLELVQAVLQTLGYWGILMFALTFPRERPVQRWQRLTKLFAVGAAALAGLLVICSFGTALGFQTETVTRASLYLGHAIALAVIPIVWFRYRSLAFQNRQRMFWVLTGCVIGLPAYVFAEMIASTSLFPRWTSDSRLALLYLANALFLIAVVTAIKRHRLVRASFSVGRRAILLFVWCLSFLPIVLMAWYLEHELERSLFGGDERPIERRDIVIVILRVASYYVSVALLKLLVDVSVERVTHTVDRMFFRRHHRAQQRLRNAIAELQDNVASLGGIREQLIDCPTEALSLTWSSIWLREESGAFREHYVCRNTTRAISPPEPSDKLIKDLQSSNRAPIRVSDHDELVMNGSDVKAINFPSLAVPLIVHGGLVAFAFYGAHTGGDDIDQLEIGSLGELGRAASIAWQRKELGEVQTQLATLDQQAGQTSAQLQDANAKLTDYAQKIRTLEAQLGSQPKDTAHPSPPDSAPEEPDKQ